ncbi:MAG: hypothetical protein KDI07_12650, partial [Anaerolineae bacterium]|nr:hypothetical protein [Anaerolineae bacterium]
RVPYGPPKHKPTPLRCGLFSLLTPLRVDEHPHAAVLVGMVQRHAQAGTTFIDCDTIHCDADWWRAF